MKTVIPAIFVLFFLVACRGGDIKRIHLKQVIYKETLQENDTLKVVRTCEYRLDSISYDTIFKRTRSTIELPVSSKTCVDLPADAVDLDDVGIYWDDDYRCYRKKSTEQ